MPPKSIWRGPNAQHFALVHRSQQDPLLYDADAPKRVLKAVARQSDQHGDTAGEGRLDANNSQGDARASASHGRRPTSRKQLENDLGAVAAKERGNVGEAAEYGIYFDDTEYDYMQHLRSIGGNDNSRRGGQDEAVDAEVIMLEAPQTKQQAKAKARAHEGGDVRLKGETMGQSSKLALPADVLPSKETVPRSFAEDKEMGIRPDMDPHLRQVLEALEDEAFLMRTAQGQEQKKEMSSVSEMDGVLDGVGDAAGEGSAEGDEEEDIDDFFGAIVQGGELETTEQAPDWRQLPPEGEEDIYLDAGARAARELLELRQQGKGAEDLSLSSRVALFKKAQEEQASAGDKEGSQVEPALQSLNVSHNTTLKPPRAPSSTGSKSIFGEKGPTRKSRHAGAKARLAGSFYAPSSAGGSTAFSMSSSAMERSQGLTGLDEQFARMERIYEDESEEDGAEGEEDEEDPAEKLQRDPRNIERIFDEFLDKNEVVGKRLRERLGTAEVTPVQKVDMIREELGKLRDVDRRTWDEAEAAGLGPEETVEQAISRDLRARESARRDHDVETIQTTRTNLAHRPRTITAAQSVAPSHISRITTSKGEGNGSNASIDRMPRVKIDPRTGAVRTQGFIKIRGEAAQKQQRGQNGSSHARVDTDEEDEPVALEAPRESAQDSPADDTDDDDGGSDATQTDALSHLPRDTSVRRDRQETPEAKKERKAAVKAEKQMRRAEKSQRKSQFKEASSLARSKHPVSVAGQSLA